MKRKYYLLKVSLLGITPSIWREFVVPCDITLDRLHDVIQIIMGWSDRHIHEFRIGKSRYSEFLDPNDENLILFSSQFRLNELVKRKGRTFNYIYDFGNLWDHEIIVESTNYKRDIDLEVFCVGGERACPPEDVGGVDGYEHFLEVINNPSHVDYEKYMEWSDNSYDSEYYDEKIINWLLIKYYVWSRDRYLDWSEDYDEDN